MLRLFKFGTPFLALVALAIFASHTARAADDTATTQPSGSGSVVVTVLDSSGSPVAKARVSLAPRHKKSEEGTDASSTPKPKALRGTTDEDGKFTFTNVAAGDYRVSANVKKTHQKGSENVSVTDDALNPTVTINLAAPADEGGATTEPSK